jgi:hypothetical protein
MDWTAQSNPYPWAHELSAIDSVYNPVDLFHNIVPL